MSSVRVPGRMAARSPPGGAGRPLLQCATPPWGVRGPSLPGRLARSRSVEVPLTRGLSFGHVVPAPSPPRCGLLAPGAAPNALVGFRTNGAQNNDAALALIKVSKALEAAGVPRRGASPGRAVSHSPPPKLRPPAPGQPVPAKAACSPVLQARGPTPAGTQSTQSLQSVSRCSTATSARTAEVSQPAARRVSGPRGSASPGRKVAASLGPSVTNTAQSTVTTLPASTGVAPPAKVVPVPVERLDTRHGCDPTTLQQQLERIQQEVHSIAQAQRQSEELDQTKERAKEMSGLLQRQRKEMQDAEEKRQERAAQLRDRMLQAEEAEGRLQEAEKTLLDAVEEHKRTKRSLAKAGQELDGLRASRERLEEEQRNAQEVGEADHAYAEQMNSRCQELQKAEHDLTARLEAANAEAREAEEEKRALAVELGQAQERLREAGGEAQRQAAQAEQLEEELRESQRSRQSAEDSRQLMEKDLQQWREAGAECDKENLGPERAATVNQRVLEDLQSQLLRERLAVDASSPASYLKLARAQEEESCLATENSRLKKVLTKMQCDICMCVQRIEEQGVVLQQLRASGARPQA